MYTHNMFTCIYNTYDIGKRPVICRCCDFQYITETINSRTLSFGQIPHALASLQ